MLSPADSPVSEPHGLCALFELSGLPFCMLDAMVLPP